MPKTATGHYGDDDDDGPTDCPECGAEVYAIADCCPKCGYWFVEDDRETVKAKREVSAQRYIVKIGAVVLLTAFAIGAVVAVIDAF